MGLGMFYHREPAKSGTTGVVGQVFIYRAPLSTHAPDQGTSPRKSCPRDMGGLIRASLVTLVLS